MKLAKIIASIIMMLIPTLSFASYPAQDVLTKASAKIRQTHTLTAKFNGTISGTLISSGNKFSVVAGGFGMWYDGKDMWTYSHKAGETTLTCPTPSELLEANPLEIIKSYSSQFNATKVSENGNKYTLRLTPKTKNNNVKEATLTINTSSWYPTSVDIVFSNNTRFTINITSITSTKPAAASTFVYPQAEYPGIEVVDLR